MRRFFGFILSASAACSALWACTPSTPYRYSALVPAARPLAWNGRTATDGSLRVEGTLNAATVNENISPKLHDTAVWVPKATVDTNAAIAVAPGVEVGGRFSYASFAWARQSANGTMPIPNSPAVYGVGPELRVTVPLDREKKFALGFAGNVMRYMIPVAEWTKTAGCTAPATCVTDTSTSELGGTTYKLTDHRVDGHWVYNVGLYPSMALGDRGDLGHVIGYLGFHLAFENDGFTDTKNTKGAAEGAGPLTILGAGYGFSAQPFRVAFMLYKPLTGRDSPVSYGLGGFLSIGVDLELWQSEEARYGHRAPSGM